MRTLIIGEGKSGTTALLRSVASAMGGPGEIFEPEDLSMVDLSSKDLVVKKLLHTWRAEEVELLDRFDRVVFIVRDPRDRLISHMLYDAYNRAAELSDDQKTRWLGVLTRKSETPLGEPYVRLVDIWWQMTRANLLDVYMRSLKRTNDFTRAHGERVHIMRYEDIVDARFESLSDYLGKAVGPAEVRASERRVKRSSRYGEWRNWYTPIDVNVFRPLTTTWLRRHGYPHHDWELSADPSIEADTSVDYVRGLLASANADQSRKLVN